MSKRVSGVRGSSMHVEPGILRELRRQFVVAIHALNELERIIGDHKANQVRRVAVVGDRASATNDLRDAREFVPAEQWSASAAHVNDAVQLVLTSHAREAATEMEITLINVDNDRVCVIRRWKCVCDEDHAVVAAASERGIDAVARCRPASTRNEALDAGITQAAKENDECRL